jgi:hypothetical protein
MDTKRQMLDWRVSQKEFMSRHFDEPSLNEIAERFGRNAGQAAGFVYAEGFRQHVAPPFPSDNIVVKLLGARHIMAQREVSP